MCTSFRTTLTRLTFCDTIILRQESYAQADKDTRTGARLDVGLHNLEPKGAAKKNEGFFEKGLLKAMESDHLAGGSAREVKVVGNGHCHRGSFCSLSRQC